MTRQTNGSEGCSVIAFCNITKGIFFQNCFCTRQAKSEAFPKIKDRLLFFLLFSNFLEFLSFISTSSGFFLCCSVLCGPPNLAVHLCSSARLHFFCHLFVGTWAWGTCVAGHNLSRLIIDLKSCLDSRSIPDLILLFYFFLFLCLSWVEGRKCVSSAGLRLWGIANGILRCYGTHVPADSR